MLLRRIIVYSFIAISIVAVFTAVPGYKIEVTPLGNVLSAYFYNKHTATPNLYTNYELHLAKVTDYKLKKFYKQLDWHNKGTQIDFTSDIDATWQMYTQKGVAKLNYMQYWQTIRPQMQDFYTKTITPLQVKSPVVHFRCSDAPFVEHPLYHLTKATTVNWIIANIKERGFNDVIMLSCNKHRRVKNNPCSDYLKFYVGLFNQAGIKVTTQCHDVYKDFAMMVHSPLLVSLNESSFAFIAGIAKDPNDYISCNFGREHEGSYLEHTEADWLMSANAPLLHKDVANYFDVAAVLTQLNN